MKNVKLMVILLMAFAFTSLYSQTIAEAHVLDIAQKTEQIALDMVDSDVAFEGYVNQLFGIGKPQPLRLMAVRILGASLTGNNKTIHDALKAQIIEVAAGERSSTILTVTVAQMGLDCHYYASDLGVTDVIDGNQIAPDAAQAMRALSEFESSKIVSVLLRDCPYEMYWCDKTIGASVTGFGLSGMYDRDREEYYLYFTGDVTFKFSVAKAYRADGATDIYTIDTTIVRTAATAASNALSVVTAHASDEDYDKLLAYKNWICNQVSYNSNAASGNVAYGNPWQLIWVFDGDESTNVVCEGYAKAFQYLCNKSDFRGNVDCRTVTGKMDGANHMWNVVKMPNDKNYMVDVTNCDNGSIGYPDKLFLAGYASGNVESGYHMAAGKDVAYEYDETTRGLYSEDELTLSERSYLKENQGIPIDATHFPDEAFRGIVEGFDADPEGSDGYGYLSTAEQEAVIELDVSANNIKDLAGIRYFSMLETLNCSENTLNGLNLEDMATLTALDCSGNKIESLLLTGCTGLEIIDCSNNALTGIEVSDCKALTSLDCSDNALTGIEVSNCKALTSLDCSDNALTGIEVSDCKALTSLDCSNNALTGVEVSNCKALTSLDCSGNSLTTLDVSECATLKTLAVHENLVLSGSYAKYSNGNHKLWFDTGVRLIRSQDALVELALPEATTVIEASAFEGTSVECVVIPNGCTSIGSRAFADCATLAEVRMPVSLSGDSLSDDVFSGSEDAIIVTENEAMQAWAVDHGMLWCGE